jgi:hypothetical protein
MTECGAVEEVLGGGDAIERELAKMRNEQAVKTEMEKIKAGGRAGS